MLATRRWAAATALIGAAALAGMSAGCASPAATSGSAATTTSTPATATQITVSAAQSMKDPLTTLTKTYEAAHPGTTVTLNFGGSGQLSQQIQQGAPVDLFMSASAKDPDALRAKGMVAEGTYKPFLSNTLVVAVPKGNPAGVKELQSFATPAVKRWVTGNPASVPHGAYTQQSFEMLKLWAAVQPKAVFSENVAQTLAYVENGSVDAGVLFKSEAQKAEASGTVEAVYTVPDNLHKPIVYVAVGIKGAKNLDAAKLYEDFVTGPEALPVYEAAGFKALPAK